MRSNLLRVVSVVVFNAAVALSLAPLAAGEIYVSSQATATFGVFTISEYSTSGAPIITSIVTGSQLGPIAAIGNDLFVQSPSFPNPTTVSEYNASGALVNASFITTAAYADTEFYMTSGNNLWGEGPNSRDVPSLLEWNTSGTLIDTIPLPGTTANGETTYVIPSVVGSSGSDIFLVYGTTLSEWTTTGTVVNASLITGLAGGVAVFGSDIFVGNSAAGSHESGTDYVSEYNTSGTLLNPSLVTGLTEPGEIAVSGGNLFVESQGGPSTEVIGEYTLAGAPVNTSLLSGPTFGSGALELFVVVPEPATWLLAVIGLIGILLARRRR